MTIGPAPMIRIEEMSVRRGIRVSLRAPRSSPRPSGDCFVASLLAMTGAGGGDAFGGELEMPVALQGAFGQADRFADQAFAQALADRIAEGIKVDRIAGNCAKAFESRLDVRLADHVVECDGQQ